MAFISYSQFSTCAHIRPPVMELTPQSTLRYIYKHNAACKTSHSPKGDHVLIYITPSRTNDQPLHALESIRKHHHREYRSSRPERNPRTCSCICSCMQRRLYSGEERHSTLAHRGTYTHARTRGNVARASERRRPGSRTLSSGLGPPPLRGGLGPAAAAARLARGPHAALVIRVCRRPKTHARGWAGV